MKKIEIEHWVLSIIDRVIKRQPVEDCRVELKAEWVPSARAARRLAGHLNAARGEQVLWIIGVDEQNATVPGANHVELSNWFDQVKAQFNGLAPSLQDLAVPTQGRTVVALLFDSDRAPHVVKAGNGTEYEVPWREATRVRSATRENLIRLLAPIAKQPDIELREVAVFKSTAPVPPIWGAWIRMYIIPRDESRLIIPYHHCSASIHSEEPPLTVVLDSSISIASDGASSTVQCSATEATITGPGQLILRATSEHHNQVALNRRNLRLRATLHVVGPDCDLVQDADVVHIDQVSRDSRTLAKLGGIVRRGDSLSFEYWSLTGRI